MRKCSLVSCGSTKNEYKPNLTIHRLPRNENKKLAWLKAIGSGNLRPNREIVICSLHFEECSFNRTLDTLRLRDDAVPTLFLKEQSEEPSTPNVANRAVPTSNQEQSEEPSTPNVANQAVPTSNQSKVIKGVQNLQQRVVSQKRKIKCLQEVIRRQKIKIIKFQEIIKEHKERNKITTVIHENCVHIEECVEPKEFIKREMAKAKAQRRQREMAKATAQRGQREMAKATAQRRQKEIAKATAQIKKTQARRKRYLSCSLD